METLQESLKASLPGDQERKDSPRKDGYISKGGKCGDMRLWGRQDQTRSAFGTGPCLAGGTDKGAKGEEA